LTDTRGSDGVSPAIVRAEVMLDRVHAAPGVIDGRDGENFLHALEIYEKAKGLKVTKGLDDNVWSSLLAESGGPVLMEYVLTDQDVEGPFFPNLPKDYGELAKLKAMGYRNPSQQIGAMFHMGEDLLATLNPGVDLSKAGTKILVAEETGKTFLTRIEQLINEVGFDADCPAKKMGNEQLGERWFLMDHADNRRFLQACDDGFRHSRDRRYALRMPGKTSFTEEFVCFKNCDDGLLALLRNDGDLHLAFLDVEDRIRRISL